MVGRDEMNIFEQMLLTREGVYPSFPNFHPEFDSKLDSLVSNLDDSELSSVFLVIQLLCYEP